MQQNSPAYTLEETWNRIKVGVDACFYEKRLSRPDWIELQTFIYNFSVDVSDHQGHNHLRNSSSGRSRSSRNIEQTHNPRSSEIYEKMQKYYVEFLKNLSMECSEHPGEDLLLFYKRKWGLFKKAANVVDGLYKYVNSSYVKRQREAGASKGSFTINELALVSWRETFFAALKTQIMAALSDLIAKERNGEQMNSVLISDVVLSLVDLSITNRPERSTEPTQPSSAFPANSANPGTNNIFFYVENFENEFISETKQFYERESANFIREHPFTDYLKKAASRLEEEKSRVLRYLHSNTMTRLISTCEDVLISHHIDQFYTEFTNLLREHKVEDLTRIYDLCSRVKNTVEKLQQLFQDHVKSKGLAAMERLIVEAENSKGPAARQVQPKAYVGAILQVHKTYAELIKNAFSNNPGFLGALDKANELYINKNPVTEQKAEEGSGAGAAGPARGGAANANQSRSSAEFLAAYFDSLLRISNKKTDDSDLEEHLTETMTIFKYISDKDVFSRHYNKSLAKRLVQQISVSDDAEQSMIEKLKSTCGFEYTTKLQKMFTDVNVSKKLSEDFKRTTTRTEFDFTIIVGTQTSWPLPIIKNYIIATEFKQTFDSFTAYYNTKYNGRKLQWLWSNCKGELQTTGFLGKPYCFMASLYQMNVLLLFNKQNVWSVQSLIEECGITNKEAASQVLQQLMRQKIIQAVVSGSDETHDDTELQLNLKYENKKTKVNIAMPVKAELKRDREHTDKQVEEDRKNVLQAAIVRIMKTRKRRTHQELIQETIHQVNSRFQPSISSIKKEIDNLIEKDYLKRVENERNLYEYVA